MNFRLVCLMLNMSNISSCYKSEVVRIKERDMLEECSYLYRTVYIDLIVLFLIWRKY